MDLLIKYIGNDSKFWSKLKQKFASDYKKLNLHFTTEFVDEDFNPRQSFKKTYKQNPSIVYVDFSSDEKKCLTFCKLFNRNNVTRLKSIVALHDNINGWSNINRAIIAGVRINHFKGIDVTNVTYDPISLLDVELAKDPEYVYGKGLGSFELKQILRVSYVQDDCFHIETNSYLPEGEVIEITNHPLVDFMDSKRFYVKSFQDSDLYYNTRFSYDLEFSYLDSDFFKSTEQSWLLYKKFQGRSQEYKKQTGKRYEDLVEDIDKRKKNIGPIKKSVHDWIEKNTNSVRPKKVKVMIIDDSMEIFSQIDNPDLDFPYAINIQNRLTKDNYQVKRTMPHLIAIHCDEINTIKDISLLVDQIKENKNYNPYILIFNYIGTDLKKDFNYELIITYRGTVDLDTLKSMAQILDQKLHLSSNQNRVYFETSTKGAVITYSRDVKVIAMTESIIYFCSDLEIPMWTTFFLKKSFKMLVTVIPHKSSGKFKDEKNCYRAMINGLGELEMQKLRIMINESLDIKS